MFWSGLWLGSRPARRPQKHKRTAAACLHAVDLRQQLRDDPVHDAACVSREGKTTLDYRADMISHAVTGAAGNLAVWSPSERVPGCIVLRMKLTRRRRTPTS